MRNPLLSPAIERAAIAVASACAVAWVLLWAQAIVTSGSLDAYVLRPADLVSGIVGATLVAQGKGELLYDFAAQHAVMAELLAPERALAEGELLPYTHAPWEAIALAPLVRFGPGAVYAIWSAASLAAVAASLALLARARPLGAPLLAIAAGLSFFPVTQGLVLGQGSTFVLLGIAAAFAGTRLDKPGWIGLGVALTTLKPQVTPFVVLMLLFERQWRGLTWAAGILAAATALAAVPLGLDWPAAYVDWLRQVARWQDHHAINPAIMTNWRGLAVAGLGHGNAATAVTIIASITTTAAFAFVAEPLRRRDPDAPWALMCVVAVLAGLHAHPYEQTLLLPAGWLAVGVAERTGQPLVLLPVAAIWIAAWPWDDTTFAPIRATLLVCAAVSLGLQARTVPALAVR